jgi:simple sugar transport system permease protein
VHVSPVLAFSALWQGAFGDTYALSETLVRTIPLLFTGLGVALAFRCGVWNIGAEGQFLVGAAAVMAVLHGWTPFGPLLGIPALLLAGAVAGAVWAGIPALLLLFRQVPEVISTIMLNFVAIQLFSWGIRGPLQEAARRYPQSDPVPDRLQLWRFLPPTRLHTGLFLALLAMAGLHFFLFYTVPGFQVRATGLNRRAAFAAGIPTPRAILLAMGLGGALAGLGGAVELMGVTYRLFEPFSPGYGYTAIAVALVGGLNPFWIGGAALLFGALDVGSGALQRVAGVPAVMVSIIQGVILFFVAWNYARRRKAVGG